MYDALTVTALELAVGSCRATSVLPLGPAGKSLFTGGDFAADVVGEELRSREISRFIGGRPLGRFGEFSK